MGFSYNVNVLNQKGSPAIYTDTFANRPSPGYAGRLFVSSDTSAIYEDTGTAWTLIANVSSGAGTLQQVTTNGNTTDKGIQITAIGLTTNNITDTALTAASVPFISTGGLFIDNPNNFVWNNTNNRLGIGTNNPTNTLDLHYGGTGSIIGINNTAGNQSAILFVNTGVNKWRIGNSSTNTFDVYNSVTGTNAISIDNATNLVSLIGALTAAGSITSQVNNSNFGTSANGQIPIIIQSNTTARAIRLKNSAAGYSDILVTGTASSSTFGINTFSTADAFRINDDGTVEIGNTNGTVGKLNVTGRIALTTSLFFSSNLTAEDRWEINGNNVNQLAFTKSGTGEFMRLTSGGNLLINSTTDDTVNKLQVTGSGKFSSTVTATQHISANNTSAPQINLGSLLCQSYGVNNSWLSDNFYFNGTNNKYLNTGYATTLYIGNGDGSIQFATAPSGTAGNTISFTNRLNISNAGIVTMANLAGTGSRAVLADASGNLSAPVSDISVKENIKPLKYGLETIMKLNAVQFEFIEGYKNYGEGLQIGAIAQEVEQIIPEAVFKTPSTGLKGIDYNQFNGIYIKAIQELNERIELLLSRIEYLENK